MQVVLVNSAITNYIANRLFTKIVIFFETRSKINP